MTYAHASTIPGRAKAYDRALDIIPNDPDIMASKAGFIRPRVTWQKPLSCYQK